MLSADSYANHLRMLDEVTVIIQSLKRYLREMEIKYKQQIDSAEGTGFMQDYTDQLKQRHQHFSEKIDALSGLIEKHDGQIEQQKEVIQQLKEFAQSNRS